MGPLQKACPACGVSPGERCRTPGGVARARPHSRRRVVCSVRGCRKPHFGLGYCNMHYCRLREHGDVLLGRERRCGRGGRRGVCKVEGCGQAHRGLGYCGKHYARLRQHGDALAAVRRWRLEPGERQREQTARFNAANAASRERAVWLWAPWSAREVAVARDRSLTVRQAAARLGRTLNTVKHMRRAGNRYAEVAVEEAG